MSAPDKTIFDKLLQSVENAELSLGFMQGSGLGAILLFLLAVIFLLAGKSSAVRGSFRLLSVWLQSKKS